MTLPDDYANADLDCLRERDSRQLLEARMLPDKGPLSKEQRDQVTSAVNAYIQKHGLTQQEVCRQVSVGAQALSGILRGTYDHAPLDGYLRGLNDWLEVDARRRRTKPFARYVETRVAKRIMNCAVNASNRKQMVLVHGPTGIGKSLVAHVVADKFPGAIYLRISSGNTSFTSLRRMLATHLRLFGRRRSQKRDEAAGLTLDERIFDVLRDSHRLIIVDEAHRVAESALDFLRDLYDECRTPILLLCTKDLLDRVRRDSDEDHGQLYSRIHVADLVYGFDKVPGGKKPLFTVADIRKIFESDKVRLLPEARGYLQDAANMLGHGSLRLCDDIMALAVDIERSVKDLGPQDALTVSEPLLRKAEMELKADPAMREDITSRGTVAVAASA